MRKINHEGWKLLSAIPEDQARELFNTISKKHFEEKEWLKKHHRSDVIKFFYNGKNLVLKIPKEKNSRPWIRFTTLYRKGEAFKNLRSMDLLWKIGIKTTVPVLAAEKRLFGMVVDSWLVYEYLEGENCLEKYDYYPHVVALLSGIHKKGYLHNDPQIRNFILSDHEIYIIDSNPARPALGLFSKIYEYVYLAKSAPGIKKYFQGLDSGMIYKLMEKYDKASVKFSNFRKKVKRPFK